MILQALLWICLVSGVGPIEERKLCNYLESKQSWLSTKILKQS